MAAARVEEVFGSATAQVTADDARIDQLKELLRSTPLDLDFERVRIMYEMYGLSLIHI